MENLSISDEEGDTRNWENELEELTDLVNNPVNINSATKEQLQTLSYQQALHRQKEADIE